MGGGVGFRVYHGGFWGIEDHHIPANARHTCQSPSTRSMQGDPDPKSRSKQEYPVFGLTVILS